MKNKKGVNKKGSVTVEAALIISSGIIIVAFLLSLFIHIYRKCMYTQMACETVLYGSWIREEDEEDGVKKTKEKWEEMQENFYPVWEKPDEKIWEQGNSMEISVSGTAVRFKNFEMNLDLNCHQKIHDPVKKIRKLKAMAEIGDEDSES